jgi:hypothetical protein
MAVLQEMIVTIIYIAVGLTVPKFAKETKGKSGESKLTRARRRSARGWEWISKGWARLTGSTHRSEDHKQYEDEIASLEWGYNGNSGKRLQWIFPIYDLGVSVLDWFGLALSICVIVELKSFPSSFNKI